MNNILSNIKQFKESFIIAVGDRSPFAKQALMLIDSAISEINRIINFHPQAIKLIEKHRQNEKLNGTWTEEDEAIFTSFVTMGENENF